MRKDICSIPISEIFEPKDGCPFCRMRDMLEDRMGHLHYRRGHDGAWRARGNEPSSASATNIWSRSYSAAAACPSPLFSKVS